MSPRKTLGEVGAHLISSLYETDRTIFTVRDIEKISGLGYNAATKLGHDLTKRKIIARIKPGKYIIIPQEIGSNTNYIGNWYVAAREIVNSPDYYISHYSAMDLHNMLTHPLTRVYVTTPKQEYKKQKNMGNTIFEFIYMNAKYVWGVQHLWVTKSEQVRVSDIERTVIDCLHHPKYCGGVLEIAKGLWMQKENIDFNKLFSYALRLNRIVVIKRLGYMLEVLNLKEGINLDELRGKINSKYYVLDPLLSTEQTYKNSWRMIVNISPEEMKQSVST